MSNISIYNQMMKEAREHAEHIMDGNKDCTWSEPKFRRETLKDTLKKTNDKTLKQQRFIAMKRMDSDNEKMDKDYVKKAHTARQCKNRGHCFEKHLDEK